MECLKCDLTALGAFVSIMKYWSTSAHPSSALLELFAFNSVDFQFVLGNYQFATLIDKVAALIFYLV